MMQQVSLKVPFRVAYVSKCMCLNCPVQERSAGVASLKEKLGGALTRRPLHPVEIPGQYCGAGEATCDDLDPKQTCICGGCPVFAQRKLASGTPVGYYCRYGASK